MSTAVSPTAFSGCELVQALPSRANARFRRSQVPTFFTLKCESDAMSPLLGMFGIGQTELIIVAVIILILFGHRLPSLMFSLGKGVNTFKEGLNAKGEPDDGTTATVTDKNKE